MIQEETKALILEHSEEINLDSAEIGKIVVDIVNEVVSNLPQGHQNKNSKFAKGVLQQIFEILSEKEDLALDEVKDLVFTLANHINIL